MHVVSLIFPRSYVQWQINEFIHSRDEFWAKYPQYNPAKAREAWVEDLTVTQDDVSIIINFRFRNINFFFRQMANLYSKFRVPMKSYAYIQMFGQFAQD